MEVTAPIRLAPIRFPIEERCRSSAAGAAHAAGQRTRAATISLPAALILLLGVQAFRLLQIAAMDRSKA